MSSKIILKHSRIEINNYDLGDAPRIEYLFSIFNKINFQREPMAIEYDPNKRILYLPRGMNIDLLTSSFYADPVLDKECDPYIDNPTPIPIKYLAKDERQMEILKFLLGVDKYAYTQNRSQLSVNSTTGSGKTFVTVGMMCFTGARVIIITSNTGWLEQWKTKIKEYTNLKDKDIYMIAGRASIDKLLSRDPLQYQVFLASHSTLYSYGMKTGWDSISELFKYLRCRIKVFDEAHLYFDNMARLDYHTNTNKTIYLTATPLKSSSDADLIYQEYFRNIASIELFDEDKDPHVNYIALLFHSNPTPYEIKSYTRGPYNFDRNIYTDYLVNKPNFIKLLDIIIDMTLPMPGKILIYIGKNEAILNVYNYMIQTYPFLTSHVGIYTSIVDKAEKPLALTKKYILTTTKSCGAASDISKLVCTVNLAEPFVSQVTTRQTLGRCRDNNTVYLDCVDMSCYKTKLYYKKKRTVFLKYAKSCKEHYFNELELDNLANNAKNNLLGKIMMTMPVFKN